MKCEDVLLKLVRAALWNTPMKPIDVKSEAYYQLMEASGRQAVTGLLCRTLMTNNYHLKKLDAVDLFAASEELEKSNTDVDTALAELVRLLDTHKIPFVVFKGQTLATLYPSPHSRIPGDIDFYVDPDNFNKAAEVISKEWHVDIDTNHDDNDISSPRHIEFKYKGVLFEMHFRMLKFYSNRNQVFFNNIVDECDRETVRVADVDVPILPLAPNIVYTFCHLYHHLQEQGVALRQLCDLALLIHHTSSMPEQRDSVRKEIGDILDGLNMRRAFVAVCSALVESLGLPEEDLPFPVGDNERHFGRKMMEEVWKRGNWGVYDRQLHNVNPVKRATETGTVQLSHYISFYRLSPRENRAMILKEIPMKFINIVKKLFKKNKL